MTYIRRAELNSKIEAGASLTGIRLATSTPMQRMAELDDADRERIVSELGEEAAKSRLVRFVISTEKRARDGWVIRADGWELEEYRKNPVVLWNHEARWGGPRIGDSAVYLDGKTLRAVCSFLPREVSELAYSLGEIAATRGHAASVGFSILDYLRVDDPLVLEEWPWALDITLVELTEWSLVNVPSDTDAYAEARARGIPTQAVADFAAELMDEGSPARAFLERLYASSREAPAPVVSAPAAPTIIEPTDWKKEIAGALG